MKARYNFQYVANNNEDRKKRDALSSKYILKIMNPFFKKPHLHNVTTRRGTNGEH